MKLWTVYERATGVIVSRLSCRPSQLEANVPDGCSCVPGHYDSERYRIVDETQEVADYIPPAPRPPEKHRWNGEAWRWERIPHPYATLVESRRAAYPPIEELADALYWQSRGDPSRMEAYLAACEEVKQRFPKPAEVGAKQQSEP